MNRRELLQATAGAGLGLGLPAALADDSLIHKAIPATGDRLPVIGLGTNRYQVGDEQLRTRLGKALTTFAELGGTLIDTAPMYRSSETILGQLIEAADLRARLFIATKSDRDADAGGLERLENSFRQLGDEQLDLVQSHNLRGAASMLPVLRELKAEQRIRYVGITTSRAAQFEAFETVMRQEPLDFIQVNYSLADRAAEARILPLAAERGMAVLVNLPLGRGKLFDAVGDRPLPPWAAEFGCNSWAQFFLKYVVSHPAVTCAIPGMSRAEHVADNLGALRGRLPDPAQRRRQERLLAEL